MGLAWCTSPWIQQNLFSPCCKLPRSFRALRRARSSTARLLMVDQHRRGMEMSCSLCMPDCSLGIFLTTSAIIWIRDLRNRLLAANHYCSSYWTASAMNRGRNTVHRAWIACIRERFGSTGTCFRWPILLCSRCDFSMLDSAWSLGKHSLVNRYILLCDSWMELSYLNFSLQRPRIGLTSLRSGS